MGRKRNPNSRRSIAEKRRHALALQNRVEPAQYILDRRELFSFVTPTKGPDGRVGEIDQDICDPIGQLHAVGLLDGHGHDPQELRDKGRIWAGQFAVRYGAVGIRSGAYERRSRSTGDGETYTAGDLMFDRIDPWLTGYERNVLLDLLVEPLLGHHEGCPWAESFVAEELIARGKLPPWPVFHGEHERGMLAAAIRGLCMLVDASLGDRRMAA